MQIQYFVNDEFLCIINNMGNNNKDELANSIIYNLENTTRIAKVLACRYFENNFDITFSEHIILNALYFNPKIHQRDLAKLIYKGTANLSRDLEKLEKRGLIKRNIETKEKRIVKTLVLTKKGLKTCEKINIKTQTHLEQMENIFTQEEHQQFISLLEKLRNRLTESHDMIFE